MLRAGIEPGTLDSKSGVLNHSATRPPSLCMIIDWTSLVLLFLICNFKGSSHTGGHAAKLATYPESNHEVINMHDRRHAQPTNLHGTTNVPHTACHCCKTGNLDTGINTLYVKNAMDQAFTVEMRSLSMQWNKQVDYQPQDRGFSFERNCVLRRWESETLRCSRKRSPNLRPVSPMYIFLHKVQVVSANTLGILRLTIKTLLNQSRDISTSRTILKNT